METPFFPEPLPLDGPQVKQVGDPKATRIPDVFDNLEHPQFWFDWLSICLHGNISNPVAVNVCHLGVHAIGPSCAGDMPNVCIMTFREAISDMSGLTLRNQKFLLGDTHINKNNQANCVSTTCGFSSLLLFCEMFEKKPEI